MTSETVLIIEDDPTMLRGLKDNFEFEGYSVATASDGEQGLEAALDNRPDLIILDIMLPKINGYEICQILRKEGLDVPVIMLTAKGQETDIVLGLNLGADDYVTKPFSIRELLARPSEVFLKSPATSADCLNIRLRRACTLVWSVISDLLFTRPLASASAWTAASEILIPNRRAGSDSPRRAAPRAPRDSFTSTLNTEVYLQDISPDEDKILFNTEESDYQIIMGRATYQIENQIPVSLKSKARWVKNRWTSN